MTTWLAAAWRPPILSRPGRLRAVLAGGAALLVLGTPPGAGAAPPARSRPGPAALTSYVNPFIGTGAKPRSLGGYTFPGAAVPFGLVQLSPDTQNQDGVFLPPGYRYQDSTIVGFSHTHLSGTGIPDLFDVLLMPTTGPVRTDAGVANRPSSGYRSRFSHQQEAARPGYYRVRLQDYDITAELTATAHAGLHRYTYPTGPAPAHLVLDLTHSMVRNMEWGPCRILQAQLRVVDAHTVEGYRLITGWAPVRKVFFRAEFSQPIAGHVLLNGDATCANAPVADGTALKAVFDFAPAALAQPLLVKVGLSTVSAEGARLNLRTELPGWDFDSVAARAAAQWEHELQCLVVDGTLAQKQIFYTGLYHAFLQPNNLADVNGDYLDAALQPRRAPDSTHYSTFSLWDTYRATHPLYALVQPARAAGFVRSLLRQYDAMGFLPIWQLWGQENYCMIANPAIPVVVDAVLKGVPGLDAEQAYAAVRGSSLTEHPESAFSLWEAHGYLPADRQPESVSTTLEMAYDDWCVAQLARRLGHTADAAQFGRRAAFYQNLYDAQTGFFRPKDHLGQWVAPFDPLRYNGPDNPAYTEGNAWQWRWSVLHDVPGLVALSGGPAAFADRLDQFFALAPAGARPDGNASGFIGQYAHGNEPSHHVAYLYSYAGQPWKTQQRVAQILAQFYDNTPGGLIGNEDCGQMSAWYLFSAMGLYPVNPVDGRYVFGSPALRTATLHLPGRRQFRIVAHRASPANPYIQRVRLNGRPYDRPYLTHADLVAGGELVLEMGPRPNRRFGAGESPAPAPGAGP